MKQSIVLPVIKALSTLVLSAIALAGALLLAAPHEGRMLTLFPSARAAMANSAALSAGLLHSCAIKNGALYCWGLNQYGRLGDGTTTQRNTPVTVTNMTSGVTAVSAGGFHTCAIRNGALYCWGYNYYGQLGDGTTTQRNTPVTVTNMTSGVTAVAAGVYHTCAIRNGVMYCWGKNSYGELGASSSETCGSLPCSTVPLTTTNMSAGVTAISAGSDYTCAIRNGALYCWGDSFFGQTGGAGGVTNPVTDMSSQVTAIAAGGAHTCAIRSGALLCWGRNNQGQLGDNTTTDRSAPVTVTTMVSGVTALSAGSEHTCAIRSQTLYCWGSNQSGQVGFGTTWPSHPTPVPVTIGDMQLVDAGGDHTLAIRRTTCLFAWGSNMAGQLGNNSTANQNAPVQVLGGCDWGPIGTFSKAAPTNMATALPFDSLTLSWNAPSGTVNHYRYCYTTQASCTPLAQVPGSTLSATINVLSPATTFRWQVVACADSDCNIFADANSGTYWRFSTQGGISFVDTIGPNGTRKEVTPVATRMGELLTYTIVVSNGGNAPVPVRITDTLALSATLVSATPGYALVGNALVWQNVVVPANGVATFTITVRAASGPLPGGYALNNAVLIRTLDGQITRSAPQVSLAPHQAFLPLARR